MLCQRSSSILLVFRRCLAASCAARKRANFAQRDIAARHQGDTCGHHRQAVRRRYTKANLTVGDDTTWGALADEASGVRDRRFEQHVGGFQIAVHDGEAVQVVHAGRNVHERPVHAPLQDYVMPIVAQGHIADPNISAGACEALRSDVHMQGWQRRTTESNVLSRLYAASISMMNMYALSGAAATPCRATDPPCAGSGARR